MKVLEKFVKNNVIHQKMTYIIDFVCLKIGQVFSVHKWASSECNIMVFHLNYYFVGWNKCIEDSYRSKWRATRENKTKENRIIMWRWRILWIIIQFSTCCRFGVANSMMERRRCIHKINTTATTTTIKNSVEHTQFHDQWFIVYFIIPTIKQQAPCANLSFIKKASNANMEKHIVCTFCNFSSIFQRAIIFQLSGKHYYIWFHGIIIIK